MKKSEIPGFGQAGQGNPFVIIQMKKYLNFALGFQSSSDDDISSGNKTLILSTKWCHPPFCKIILQKDEIRQFCEEMVLVPFFKIIYVKVLK